MGYSLDIAGAVSSTLILVLVPDPIPTPVRITFSISHVILEVMYVLDEVWG